MMAHLDDPNDSLKPPEITPADLRSFHQTHFFPAALDHFATQFLGPVAVDQDALDEDDELGYYADGVKRTLSDEQIAMFRHSEIQVLLKQRRHDDEDRAHRSSNWDEGSEDEEGQIEDTVESPSTAKDKQERNRSNSQRQRPEHKKRGGNKPPPPPPPQQQHVKPDLRKRTWDKVDRGLASLDYGEEEGEGKAAPAAASQRRRISYDDV